MYYTEICSFHQSSSLYSVLRLFRLVVFFLFGSSVFWECVRGKIGSPGGISNGHIYRWPQVRESLNSRYECLETLDGDIVLHLIHKALNNTELFNLFRVDVI